MRWDLLVELELLPEKFSRYEIEFTKHEVITVFILKLVTIMGSQNKILHNTCEGRFSWITTLRSLIYPLFWFVFGTLFLLFLRGDSPSEISLTNAVYASLLMVVIGHIPNIVLFGQYFNANYGLKFSIDISNSTMSIMLKDKVETFFFDDIITSKIYQANYKRKNWQTFYQLFFEDYGYWYLHLRSGEEYRITSLLTNIAELPTISNTELVYVPMPTFKKELPDYKRKHRRKVNIWKKRFELLDQNELNLKLELNNKLDKYAKQALEELVKNSD